MPNKFGKTPSKVFESEELYNKWKEKEPNNIYLSFIFESLNRFIIVFCILII